MEISLRMNLKPAIMVPKPCKTGSRRKVYELNTISCRADALATLKKSSNFYEVLSLRSENVGFDEIKKAYRNLALRYHPDVCPASAKEECTRRFVEVRKAYETLSDPISRLVYDYELGLSKSLGSVAGGAFTLERKSKFSREVWENQLSGLKKRSQVRRDTKRYGYM